MIIAVIIDHIWILDGKQMENDDYLGNCETRLARSQS